jgi:hypothetical protein
MKQVRLGRLDVAHRLRGDGDVGAVHGAREDDEQLIRTIHRASTSG